jgi:tRNA G18 (ribose-2'-O)-methylase SpoU
LVHVIPIAGPDDPRLEAYRAVRDRDVAGRGHRFIAEGRVVLEKALAAIPERLESVLVSAARLPGLDGVLAQAPESLPVFVADQAAMDQVVGFPIHRGVLAVGRRPARDATELVRALPAHALVVGLVGIANHDNMGGLFRNAAAFGADAVVLDETCCDPLYRKAIRVSVGAALTTPFAVAGDAAAMADLLAAAGFELIALSPAGADELRDLQPAPRTAALFGAEGPGLPPAILARSHTVRIAMAGGFDSLNVATTSGIVLHHLVARRGDARG